MSTELLAGFLLAGAGVCWAAVAAPELPAAGRAAARFLSSALRIDHVEIDLAQAELNWISAPWWLILRWGMAAVSGLAGYILFGLPVLGLVAALATYHLVGLGLESRRRRVEAQRQRALLDAMRFGASVLSRSGSGLQMLRTLADTGPIEGRPVFRDLLAEAGTDRADALLAAVRHMRSRLADPLFDDIAIVLALHWKRGGKLVPALHALVADWNDTLRLHREAKALRAGVDASVLLLTALPFVFLLLVHLLAPPLLQPFGTPVGEVALALSVAWMVVGYRVMQHLSQAPREERLAFREETL